MKMTWKIFWAYMVFVGVVAYRCLAQNIPYVDADSIKVVSNSLNNFGGLLTNDPNTNVNAQNVFDAIDDMMLPTSTNIVVNTNDWQNIDPTNNILQMALDWVDDNWPTNIQNTNAYMTGFQSSNAFMSSVTASNSFIVDGPGTVVNSNMALNAVGYSNMASSVTNFLATKEAVSNRFLWDGNRAVAEYSGTSVRFPSNGTAAAVVSNMTPRVDASFGSWANSNAFSFTQDGLYMIRGELHFLSSDVTFRDYNKEAYILQSGNERIINLGTVDSLNSVITGMGIVSLTNGAYIQLMGQCYFTSIGTSDYARLEIYPMGTYDGFR